MLYYERIFQYCKLYFSGGFSFVFIDQSYWQNTIATKPAQGIWGFICAMVCLFSIPVAFGTAVGGAYLVLQFRHGSPLLQSDIVGEGEILLCTSTKQKRKPPISMSGFCQFSGLAFYM